MKHSHFTSIFGLVVLLVLSVPSALVADAQEDLRSGLEALQKGEFEAARSLLESAAQALPDSVEAQMALADCYLKLGRLNDALTRYQSVLRLSPEHSQAKQLVAALTGQKSTIESQLAAAQSLMQIGAFDHAAAYLQTMAGTVADPKQRHAAELLKIEAQLWSGIIKRTLSDAIQLAQQSSDPAIVSQARVIAALVLLRQFEKNTDAPEQAAKLVAQAQPIANPWASRAKLVELFDQIGNPDNAISVSQTLVDAMAEIPNGSHFHSWAQNYAAKYLLRHAAQFAGQGDSATAIEIVWPMISDSEIPQATTTYQRIELTNGWLTGSGAIELRTNVGRILAGTGRAEFELTGSDATLMGFWLAAENARQIGDRDVSTRLMLELAAELASLSHAAHNRKIGEVLSAADSMQQLILTQVATEVTGEKQRQTLVDLALGQVERYKLAGDIGTGLSQFVIVSTDEDRENPSTINVQLIAGFEELKPGSALLKLLNSLAGSYALLGQHEFNRAAGTLINSANKTIHRFDEIALILLARASTTSSGESTAADIADGIVQRFADAGHWNAAARALEVFYESQPGNAGRWAAVYLKIRQATVAEDQRLAADRTLDDDLSDLIGQAINETVKILESDSRKSTIRSAVEIFEPLIIRYVRLQRIDLSEAVSTQLAVAGDGKLLADWALWSRINLLDRQAAEALSSAMETAGGEKLPLNDFYKSELALINQLLADYKDSPYRGRAVDRVLQISGAYQQHRSYQVATTILTEFLESNANLTKAPQIEFQVVNIALQKAQQRFAERADPEKAPGELSAEYVAAIDGLSKFMETHPIGDYTVAAENALFEVVKVYGQVGAWPVAREALDRFARAIPDFRSPHHLKLLRAATFLGELDKEYGLSLLQPTPKPSDPASFSGTIDSLASNVRYDDVSKYLRDHTEEDDPDADARGGAGGGFGGGGERGADRAPSGAASGEASRESLGLSTPLPASANSLNWSSQPGQSNEMALAMIRQSQQRQYQQIAMMESNRRLQTAEAQAEQTAQGDFAQQDIQTIELPTGSVLSEAEMKRQDEAADAAYAILIDIINNSDPANRAIVNQARLPMFWLFGFFEGQLRADRAIVLINRFLKDRPDDSAKVALAFQAINNQLTWAAQRQPNDRIDLAWLQRRHELFELAREAIKLFIVDFGADEDWVNRAQLLTAESYDREATMTASISAVRAGGLLVRSADALIMLLQTQPDHPQCDGFAQRIWNVADRLRNLGQFEPAIYVLSQIPIHFPADPLASQSILRIAELHATNLAHPLRAVETYQEFLSLNGDNEQVRSQIFNIAQQLATGKRFLESLHVYGVFVDSFPQDPRAPQALQAMGTTHQTNEAWEEAIKTYQRVLEEYAAAPIVPQVKLAVAECQINLSRWRDARKSYEEFVQQYPESEQIQFAQSRMDLLKKLDRYETLLADQQVERHKDDAQFEIGQIVNRQLQNPVKAIQEFGKVISNYPSSEVADDAQLEIGKALIALQRLDEAREALLMVPDNYPNSPLADDALFLVAQSYEQQAARLASVTLQGAREVANFKGQQGAYQDFNEKVEKQLEQLALKRADLKKAGKNLELALDEASQSFRMNTLALSGISNTARRAEQQAETESALEVANRQDRINEANREAVKLYVRAATDYPLGDKTDDALLRVAEIFETKLKDRPAAMEAYQKIVKLFPGTPVAENAAWNVAIFYEQEGKYEMAAATLRDFIRNYPGSSRVADAQFSLAEVLEELGRWVDAMDEYETFRQKFSEHPKAVVAQEQINWIRTYRK